MSKSRNEVAFRFPFFRLNVSSPLDATQYRSNAEYRNKVIQNCIIWPKHVVNISALSIRYAAQKSVANVLIGAPAIFDPLSPMATFEETIA